MLGSAVTIAICTSLRVDRRLGSVVMMLGLVRENDVRQLEPGHTCASLNDMADSELGTASEGHTPINIKVSSSTRAKRPRRRG